MLMWERQGVTTLAVGMAVLAVKAVVQQLDWACSVGMAAHAVDWQPLNLEMPPFLWEWQALLWELWSNSWTGRDHVGMGSFAVGVAALAVGMAALVVGAVVQQLDWPCSCANGSPFCGSCGPTVGLAMLMWEWQGLTTLWEWQSLL